jgi:hypothetical protein
MVKTVPYQKSRTQRSATDMSDPEIDLKRVEGETERGERLDPKFHTFMEKLRRAARAVGRNMKMLLMLALTLGLVRHK